MDDLDQRIGPNYLDLGAGEGVWILNKAQTWGSLVGLVVGAIVSGPFPYGTAKLVLVGILPLLAIALCVRVYGIYVFSLAWYAVRYAMGLSARPDADDAPVPIAPPTVAYHRGAVDRAGGAWVEWHPGADQITNEGV